MNQPSESLRWKMAVVSIGSFLVMAYIDHAIGHELVFSGAYLIPVSICAWYFGRRSVWFMSLASGLSAWLGDQLAGQPYSHYMIHYWNSFACFLVSVITGLLLHRLKRTLEERKKMNEDLQRTLEELKRSTEEIRKLQEGLQTVCAWTKQIKVGEQWMTAEEFLRTQLHLKLTHGVSPEAFRKFTKDIASKAS